MKSNVVAGLVVTSGAVLAFAAPAAQAQNASATCYVQVGTLMADPPQGVGELGAAIRQLDVALRPQVEEINLLKAELERSQQRQREAMQSEDGGDADLIALQDETRKLRADLDAKQSQLKLDYSAQREALVGPVQTRVSERARAFAAQRGCGEMKMARTADLAGLQAASAQDMTGDFVSWYVQNQT
jgi:Skp family chaperone for outer membrane proteins